MRLIGLGTPRIIAVGLAAATLTACAYLATPSSSQVQDASGSSSAEASASPDASGPASPEPSEPAGHVAAGLAIVQRPSADSPLTEIFVVQRNGQLRQVTGMGQGQSAGGAGPIWSPDGEQIAFGPSVLGSGAFPAVYVVNADGSGQRLVQQLDVEEFSAPSWSHDSRRLLYSDATPPGERRLWLANIVKNEVRRIGSGAAPRWLPDGKRITYVAGVEGRVPGYPTALTQVVYVMDLQDGRPHELVEADAAVWSPDGAAVLIETEGRLLLANADGSDPWQVAEGALPVWSPDGSRFAYLSGNDQDGRSLVAMMDREGMPLWSGAVGSAPTWSPDGSRLAVQVDYPEQVVVVLDADSGDELWEAPGSMPAWRP
jgi:Tol biopolymer transport system component